MGRKNYHKKWVLTSVITCDIISLMLPIKVDKTNYMKNLIMTLALGVFLLPTTWQVWYPEAKTLVVFYGNNDKSGICYSGKTEQYPGNCTNPTVNTADYSAYVTSLIK